MKLKERLSEKKTMVTVGTLILGIIIGGMFGPICSEENHDGIEEKVASLEDSVKIKDIEIDRLNTKVEEAKPWFDMAEEEKIAMEQEAQKIEEERIAKELEEKQVQLSQGFYEVGVDIQPGTYDLLHESGLYGFVKIDGYSQTYNIGTHDLYSTEVKNVKLKQGQEIEIDNNIVVNFIPKQ